MVRRNPDDEDKDFDFVGAIWILFVGGIVGIIAEYRRYGSCRVATKLRPQFLLITPTMRARMS